MSCSTFSSNHVKSQITYLPPVNTFDAIILIWNQNPGITFVNQLHATHFDMSYLWLVAHNNRGQLLYLLENMQQRFPDQPRMLHLAQLETLQTKQGHPTL